MIRRLLLLLTLLIAAAPTPGLAAGTVDPVELEDEVMCVVCGRVLATSGGEAADDQRALIAELAAEGLTKEQIKARLVDEYGKRVLVDQQSTVAAAAPWAAALAGLASIALLLRARRGRLRATSDGSEAAAAPVAPAPLSAADEARIDAELAED